MHAAQLFCDSMIKAILLLRQTLDLPEKVASKILEIVETGEAEVVLE
jgi:hypothetical protein